MSDLISRSVLLKKIAEEYDLNYGEILINPERFYEMVETALTAYDVEKVVAELDNEKKFWEDAYDRKIGKEKSRSYERAIDIVRKGGVE